MYHTSLLLYIISYTFLFIAHVPVFYPFSVLCFDKLGVLSVAKKHLAPKSPLSSIPLR